MAFLFHRRLAIPLWVLAFLTVALTAPPTATPFLILPTTFAIVAVGIAAIALLMRGPIQWPRTCAGALAGACGYRDPARVVVSDATGVRKLYEPNATETADALDLLRMDDDGGWHIARPPA